MIQRACARAGFVPRVVARATDFAVLLSLVAAGAGVTLVPELAARNLPQRRPPAPPRRPGDPPDLHRQPPRRRPQARRPQGPVVLDALAEAAQDLPAAA